MSRSGWTVLVAAVGFGAAGIALRMPALVLLAVGAATALVISGVNLALRPRLELDRAIDDNRVSVGEELPVVVRVTNRRVRPSIPTTAFQPFGPVVVPVALPAVGGRSTRTVPYRLPAQHRGVYPLAPLAVTRADPLGLMRSRVVATDDDLEVWVHPRTHPAAPLHSGRRLAEEGPSGGGVRQGGLVFQSLREYVVGDDVRHIHWRSTAHAGELMVREHLELTIPEGVVLVDTRAAVHTDRSFEEAIEVAASVVLASLQAGVRVALGTTGGLVLRPSSSDQALDACSEMHLEGVGEGSGLALAGDTLDAIGTAGASVLFLTGAGQPGDAAALARLTSRFAHVTTVQIHAGPGVALGGSGSDSLAVPGALEFLAHWNQVQQ